MRVWELLAEDLVGFGVPLSQAQIDAVDSPSGQVLVIGHLPGLEPEDLVPFTDEEGAVLPVPWVVEVASATAPIPYFDAGTRLGDYYEVQYGPAWRAIPSWLGEFSMAVDLGMSEEPCCVRVWNGVPVTPEQAERFMRAACLQVTASPYEEMRWLCQVVYDVACYGEDEFFYDPQAKEAVEDSITHLAEMGIVKGSTLADVEAIASVELDPLQKFLTDPEDVALWNRLQSDAHTGYNAMLGTVQPARRRSYVYEERWFNPCF